MGTIDWEGISPVTVVNYINNLKRSIAAPLQFEEIFLQNEVNKFCFLLSLNHGGRMFKAKGKGNSKKGAKNNAARKLLELLNLPDVVMNELKNTLSPNKKANKSSTLEDNASDENSVNAIDDLYVLCAKKKYSRPTFNSDFAARLHMKHRQQIWLVTCSVHTDTELVVEVGQDSSKKMAKHVAAEMVLKSLKRLRNKDGRVKVDENDISDRQTGAGSEQILEKNSEDDANENTFETKDDEEELTFNKSSLQKYVLKPMPREISAFDSFDESSVKPEEVDEIIQELQKKHEFIRYIEYKRKDSSVSNDECYRCLIQVTDNPPSFFVGTASTELDARMKCSVEFISYLKKKTFTYNNFSLFMT